MTRHIALLLPGVVCLCASCQGPSTPEENADPEEKAVQSIESLYGLVTRDETLPGRPVVEVALANTKVTDADLKVLKELKGLQSLDLGCTRITDAGLKDLKELKGLRYLKLHATQITDAGLKEMKQALPKTQIFGP